MNRIVKIVLASNLIAIAVLVFVYPNLMVGAGKLIPEHMHLETDCFACHAPLFGAASGRCISCHKPADIGRLTTKGVPVLKPLAPIPFHHKLTEQECVACHGDHAGVRRFRKKDRFDHALLQKSVLDQCHSCHKLPDNPLHRHVSEDCAQCHGLKKWATATFDHSMYFKLDSNHNVRCTTCHVEKDYRRYTCYGCHAHTLKEIHRIHTTGAIRVRFYDNCTRCHTDAEKVTARK